VECEDEIGFTLGFFVYAFQCLKPAVYTGHAKLKYLQHKNYDITFIIKSVSSTVCAVAKFVPAVRISINLVYVK